MIAVSDAESLDEPNGNGGCVLGPIDDGTARRRGAALAHALADLRGIDLLVSEPSLAAGGDDDPMPLPAGHREAHRSAGRPRTVGTQLRPVVSHHQPSVVVAERGGASTVFDGLWADPAERLASETDVLTVDGRGDADTLASILVPVAGGHHSQLAAEAAHALARANDAAVDLFHVIESDTDAARARGEEILDGVHAVLGAPKHIDTWVLEAADTAEAIIEQSNYYDLTVMGAPTVGPLERFVFGSLSKRVQQDAASPVVVAHAHGL